ncbi:MAG: hypothetical protein IPG82_22085, partial [Saprospiraceae bacterium]|nr:hypothetical protein [Saprospiraceae bacterium]
KFQISKLVFLSGVTLWVATAKFGEPGGNNSVCLSANLAARSRILTQKIVV